MERGVSGQRELRNEVLQDNWVGCELRTEAVGVRGIVALFPLHIIQHRRHVYPRSGTTPVAVFLRSQQEPKGQ